MGFSITSAVFGGTLVLCYSVSIAENRREPPTSYSTTSPENRRLSDYNEAEIVISAMILILGITEFVIGIWAAVCCYLMRPYRCCVSTLSQQVTFFGLHRTILVRLSIIRNSDVQKVRNFRK